MAEQQPRDGQRVVDPRRRDDVQRRISIRAGGVRVGAGAEQHLHYLEIALERREVERRVARGAVGVHVGARIEQESDDARVALERRGVERRVVH